MMLNKRQFALAIVSYAIPLRFTKTNVITPHTNIN